MLGHEFSGIELREEQCTDNTARCNAHGLNPTYICDDGRNVLSHLGEETQDLLFSCPPYYDLEVYSDKANDASNQESFDDFYAILDEAFSAAAKCLKNNRFAVIVVTDIRKKDGTYYDFVERVRKTMEDAGLQLYNHLILATPIGTAPYRAEKSGRVRKMIRVHQNVLVFYKGDTSAIKSEFDKLEVLDAGEDME